MMALSPWGYLVMSSWQQVPSFVNVLHVQIMVQPRCLRAKMKTMHNEVINALKPTRLSLPSAKCSSSFMRDDVFKAAQASGILSARRKAAKVSCVVVSMGCDGKSTSFGVSKVCDAKVS